MRLLVEAEVKPSEDCSKVKAAVENIFPDLTFKVSENSIVGESEEPRALTHLRQLLRIQAIRDSARSAMLKGKRENSIHFMLNKQVAFVGKVSFTEGETPLGPIKVTIETRSPDLVIDYLAPKTREGRAIVEIGLKDVETEA